MFEDYSVALKADLKPRFEFLQFPVRAFYAAVHIKTLPKIFQAGAHHSGKLGLALVDALDDFNFGLRELLSEC